MNKNIKKFGISIGFLFILVGCSSEAEKIKENQKEVCRTQIKEGQQPTEFCLTLLPEYRQIAQVPQYQPATQEQYQQPIQQVQPVQQVAPTYSSPPVVYQQAPVQQNDTMGALALGAVAGHALSNLGNGGGGGSNYYQPPSRNITTINRTTNIISRPVAPSVPIAPTPKPNPLANMGRQTFSAPSIRSSPSFRRR